MNEGGWKLGTERGWIGVQVGKVINDFVLFAEAFSLFEELDLHGSEPLRRTAPPVDDLGVCGTVGPVKTGPDVGEDECARL